MKCKCGKEMQYFKDWEKKIDGYRCECGEEKIIKAIEIGVTK